MIVTASEDNSTNGGGINDGSGYATHLGMSSGMKTLKEQESVIQSPYTGKPQKQQLQNGLKVTSKPYPKVIIADTAN